MTLNKDKLSILFIILIVCLITFILNLTDSPPLADSSNIELTYSATHSTKEIDKKEEVTTSSTKILDPKPFIEGTDRQNSQLTIIHRPVWKLEGNLIDQLETLKLAADNGDNEANYIIAMNLRYCYSSPADDIALEHKLEQANEFSDSELAMGRITEKYEYCSGIGKRQRNQFYRYSETAAINGSVAAQESIGSITANLFMESQGYKDLERDEFIFVRDNFIEQKIRFLEEAAQNGSIKALIRLSSLNHSQNYGPNGYVKSFAFNQLILELTKSNEIYNRFSWLQQRMHTKLTSDEIDNAYEMSEKWLKIIRTNGTLYLNEN